MRAAIVAALLCTALAMPARAEWPDDAFKRRGHKAYARHWDGGRVPRRKVRRVVPTSQGDAVCQRVIRMTGEQAQSESAALDYAKESWRGRVRFLFGERYTNLAFAPDERQECAPSSTADSLRDKGLPRLYRCEMSATPCRMPAAKRGRN